MKHIQKQLSSKNLQESGAKFIFMQLFPTFLLIGIFASLFCLFAYCYNHFFFPLKYENQIKTICQTYNVNPALVASIIKAESKFDENAVSSVGAVGLMQLMPHTANYIALRVNFANNEKMDLTDVNTNLELGIAYIRYLSNQFPDTYTMLCAYNAGEGNVRYWLKNFDYSTDGEKLKTTPYPETNAYVEKVMRSIPYYANKLK